MIDQHKKILIVGLGLLGGSYASILTHKGYEVGAIDIQPSAIDYALTKGIIAHGYATVQATYVGQFDILIFALYPHVFVEWIKQYQHYIKPHAILTDVTGIKVWLIDQLKNLLRSDIEYIGAHPMAGKEVYGVEHYDENMFKGANYIITPTENSTSEAIEVAQSIGQLLEVQHIQLLSPSSHDEMIGFLSQLTHCIAISLMTCKESTHLVEYTGDSFRDLTRIAKINESMWSELFLCNKEELLAQMDIFLKQFAILKEALVHEDIETMKAMMRLSTSRRSYFDQ
ncbi:MAG: prephenate dehydrogenase/arogenate dehydrogenase family protein [Anaeroplasma bactoclasticum]|nr:prephenate dehydrogenase/arogenate dehydrogenase family protein [Anaeroplasma bactoclasticum]